MVEYLAQNTLTGEHEVIGVLHIAYDLEQMHYNDDGVMWLILGAIINSKVVPIKLHLAHKELCSDDYIYNMHTEILRADNSEVLETVCWTIGTRA